MGISFDHVQYVTDLRMILGEGSSEMQFSSPFTDKEFYRSQVDPGFAGTISFIEADLFFEGGVSVIQNVTWKWQMRSKGQSSWGDLHSPVTEQWTGGTDTGRRVVLDAGGLGQNTVAPFEIRLLVSAPTSATVSVRIGGANKTPAIRVTGEAS